MSEPQTPTIQSSVAEVWGLKEIRYGPKDDKKTYKIITQNFNGPCSFIAICNILILRGDIVIEPPGRTSVSYEFLSHLVAEYLLLRSPDVDISDALSIMPYTQKGMDLNPVFTSPTAFRPAGGSGGELKLFAQGGIKLVHGWLVDPDSQEAKALERSTATDYDAAVALIAEADHLTQGRFVVEEQVSGGENPFETEEEVKEREEKEKGNQKEAAATPPLPQPIASSSSKSSNPEQPAEEEESAAPTDSKPPTTTTLTPEQQTKIADAIAVRDFLDHTQSQLTYHGLFQLASTLAPGELVALFRNSHLSVLFKSPDDDGGGEGGGLYTLVTDQVFLREPSVVWERLEDVDGGWSTFVDSDFVKASPAGGDFAGQTAEDALRAMELVERQHQEREGGFSDHELARQLQAEEEWHARQEHEEYLRTRRRTEISGTKTQHQGSKKKKSKDCTIM